MPNREIFPSSWVEAARGGDHAAFTRLMELIRGDLFRMIYHRTQSRFETEDILQDVFLQAFRKMRGLRQPDRFKPWIFSIALNRVRDFHRRGRFRALFTDLPYKDDAPLQETAGTDGGNPMETLARKDFWRSVNAFLIKLPKGEREVFTLRFVDQFTLKEIAEVLGKSESTVKTQLYRALLKFKSDSVMARLLEERSP